MFQGQGMSVVCLGRCSWAKVSAALGAKQLMLPNFVTRTGGDFPQVCLGKKKKKFYLKQLLCPSTLGQSKLG